MLKLKKSNESTPDLASRPPLGGLFCKLKHGN
jgi:hypothetical protein